MQQSVVANRRKRCRGRPLFAFLKEFWSFLRARRKYWLIPVMLVMLLLGGLIVLAHGSAFAPFIYTLF